jgi:hypothetical protein
VQTLPVVLLRSSTGSVQTSPASRHDVYPPLAATGGWFSAYSLLAGGKVQNANCLAQNVRVFLFLTNFLSNLRILLGYS